jgi:hypothetical protein
VDQLIRDYSAFTTLYSRDISLIRANLSATAGLLLLVTFVRFCPMTTLYARLCALFADMYPFSVAQDYDRQRFYRTVPHSVTNAPIRGELSLCSSLSVVRGIKSLRVVNTSPLLPTNHHTYSPFKSLHPSESLLSRVYALNITNTSIPGGCLRMI